MQQINTKPLKHIFICVNERTPDRSCCNKVGGYDVFKELKDFVLSNGLASTVFITKSGCLGYCNDVGTTITIYPDNIWYTQVKKDETQIIKDFILNFVNIHKTL